MTYLYIYIVYTCISKNETRYFDAIHLEFVTISDEIVKSRENRRKVLKKNSFWSLRSGRVYIISNEPETSGRIQLLTKTGRRRGKYGLTFSVLVRRFGNVRTRDYYRRVSVTTYDDNSSK